MTRSTLGWCSAGIQFNQFRNSEDDYLQNGCTERYCSSNSSSYKKNRSVRDGKDIILFHFKIGTQARYIFQITICKQSYECSVTHIFTLFSFLLCWGQWKIFINVPKATDLFVSNQCVHTWSLAAVLCVLPHPLPKFLSPLTFCLLPWPLSVGARQV